MVSKPFLLHAMIALSIFSIFNYTWIFPQAGTFNSLLFKFHQKIDIMVTKGPKFHPEQTDWQEVNGTEYHFNIYSAYHIIGRNPAEVLVIGTARTFTQENIICRIYFNVDCYNPMEDNLREISPNYIQFPGTIETMEENWNYTYAGVFVHCPFSGSMKPEAVSILLPNQTEPSNMIRIQSKNDLRMAGADQYDFKFSLCVHPTYKFNETLRLIEWIEFYKLMGVEQITLFNVSIGPDASCILHDLVGGSDPLIKMNVFPWHKNPIKNLSLIRSGKCAECALSAGSNDCLYRHRGISKYLAFVDLDEFIMPRENFAKNYFQLIDYLDVANPDQNIGHYLFRNGFFIRQRPDDPILLERCSGFQNDPVKYKVCRESLMMTKVFREKELQSYSHSTKYIIKPEAVKQAGTHLANILEPGYTTLNVPENIAFSHHYRYYAYGLAIETERIPQEFGNQLVNNIANKIEYFSRKCNIPGWSA